MKDFVCTNCGKCCGPVPVSQKELDSLKDAISHMPRKYKAKLKRQKRDEMTCILWDTEKKICSVYEDRPQICRMFGFYQGMECPNNPSHANGSRGKGMKLLKDVAENQAGILTATIGWKELEGGM